MTIQEMREHKMEQALNYYATIADAARALGVHPRTLYRFIEKRISND
jgi:ActR/RegA family two-component response regulator